MATNVEEDLHVWFQAAADHLPSLIASLTPDLLLRFYALYKQSTVGPCNTSRPNWFAFESKQKWDAWKSLGQMSSDESMQTYINLMTEVSPEWRSNLDTDITRGNGWVSVSTFLNCESDLDEDDKDIFDRVKENNVEKVKLFTGDVNILDENGMALIHWAADRGSAEMVKCLIDLGAKINFGDSNGQTALHYAAECGHVDVVKLLLENSADPNISCNDGLLPIDAAEEENIIMLIKAYSS